MNFVVKKTRNSKRSRKSRIDPTPLFINFLIPSVCSFVSFQFAATTYRNIKKYQTYTIYINIVIATDRFLYLSPDIKQHQIQTMANAVMLKIRYEQSEATLAKIRR